MRRVLRLDAQSSGFHGLAFSTFRITENWRNSFSGYSPKRHLDFAMSTDAFFTTRAFRNVR